MKFSLATLALLGVEGGKGGKGGKHGGVDMGGNNDRWVWDTPKCLSNSKDCSQTIELNKWSGEIKFEAEDYVNFKNTLVTINIPGRHIELQFDQDHEFGMEYHKQCGYDRLQIFTGTAATFDKTNRIARWCGPKKGNKPYDGSGKLKEVDGVLSMWDTKLDTLSSDVIIGIDFDQDFDGYSGFTLKYTSYDIIPPTLNTFQLATAWNLEKIQSIIDLLDWKNVKGAKKAVNNYFANVNKRASQPNQKCNKKWEDEVTDAMQEMMKKAFYMNASFETIVWIMEMQTGLMKEYVGKCKQAKGWPKKRDNILKKLNKNLE